MHARLIWVALLALPLLACVKAQPQLDTLPAPAAEPCPFVYVYAPGNYIIEIASGAEVILDPGVQDFDLFCSPGEARTAVNEAVRIGVLPDGDWRIFRLDGTMEDLGQRQHNNQYMLNRMAQVVDWVTE